jgi:hypothetical protein
LRVAQEMTRETSKAQLPMESLRGNDDEIRLSKEYRWTAYGSASTKLFRYLSYTSDFGEAIKPVTQVRFVHLLHIISIGYCIADIGLEAYNLRCRGYVTKERTSQSLLKDISYKDQYSKYYLQLFSPME